MLDKTLWQLYSVGDMSRPKSTPSRSEQVTFLGMPVKYNNWGELIFELAEGQFKKAVEMNDPKLLGASLITDHELDGISRLSEGEISRLKDEKHLSLDTDYSEGISVDTMDISVVGHNLIVVNLEPDPALTDRREAVIGLVNRATRQNLNYHFMPFRVPVGTLLDVGRREAVISEFTGAPMPSSVKFGRAVVGLTSEDGTYISF